MFSSPYKQRPSGASTLFGSPSKKVPLNGFFDDGVWHCNCTPRLPASHFQVKKDGKNKGRWFYTCQLEKEKGCGFFLWGDQAEIREGKAVLGNKRSEIDTTRVAVEVDDDSTTDEEYGDWPESPIREKTNGESHSVPGAYPETPRKAAKTTDIMTPGSKRKRDMEAGSQMFPTPNTGAAGGRFVDLLGSAKRGGQDSEKGKVVDKDDVFGSQTTTSTSMGICSPSITPAPVRVKPSHMAEASPSRPANPKLQYDISNEVFSLLKNQLDEDTKANLKEVLERHALRTSGIAKGRDITRVALKAKEGKIAELEARIGELEGQREMDRRIIARLRRDIAGRYPIDGKGNG